MVFINTLIVLLNRLKAGAQQTKWLIKIMDSIKQ